MKRQLFSTIFTTLLCFGMVFTMSAHKKDNDRRAIAQCKELKSAKKKAACVRCLANAKMKKKPHHFHPANDAGKRCRPNNGKP